MPLRNFKIRLGPFCECHNVGVHCKQYIIHSSRQQMRFTRHKSTQNLVGFPVYFQTFLIHVFVQRSNYHWSCFRSMRKKLHHKFKNKYITPQNVIECWLKCKIVIESDVCANVLFFSLINVSSLHITFLSTRRGTNIFCYLRNNKSIKNIALYVHVISLPRG